MVDKPDWSPDFEGVHVTTPIFDDGDYELIMDRTRGNQYVRDSDQATVKCVYLTPKMAGKVNSKGKVEEFDMSGERVSDVRLYLHSQGALRMTKQIIMAIAGFDTRDPKEEDKANKWFAKQDFTFKAVETDDGVDVELGSGWEGLIGNRARVRLSKGSYQPADEEGNPTGEPRETQEFDRWDPANK